MAAVAEDEFDLYGGEDDVYPQPDPPVSAAYLLRILLSRLQFMSVRDPKGPSCPYNVHDLGPRPRGR